MAQTLTVRNATNGTVLGRRDIEYAYLPVALVSDFGQPGWSPFALARAAIGRPLKFVRVFEFAGGFDRHAFEFLRADWAFTQFACVAHGRAGNEVAELLDDEKYRYAEDAEFLNRGWCQVFIPVGAPFAGSLLIPYLEGVKAAGNSQGHALALVWYLEAMQGSYFSLGGTRNSAASLDPSDSYFRRERIEFVPLRSLAIGTVLVPSQTPLLRSLGLDSTASESLLGSDGVVTTNSMSVNEVEWEQVYRPELGHAVDVIDDDDPVLEIPTEFEGIGHGEPRALFATSRIQTDLDVMDRVMGRLRTESGILLDSEQEIWTCDRFSDGEIEKAREEGRRRFSTSVASAQPIPAARPPGGVAAAGGGPESFAFQLAPPAGAPMTGAIEWLAMVFAGGSTRTDGITLTPTNTTPPRVTVTVEDFVLGDVVLIGSYETTGGKRVIVEPRLVVSRLPEGVLMTNIVVRPLASEVGIGDRINLEIYGKFSDGTHLRRWLRPGEFTLANSNPAAVDVSDPFAWRALAPGTAQVIVTHAGFSNVATVVVKDLFPKRTYAEWKQASFSPTELANPAISGDSADPDRDGLTTLFEYATASDPHRVDSGQVLRIERQNLAGSLTHVLVARLSSTLSGHQVILQQSDNLTQWSAYYTLSGKPSLTDPVILDYSDLGSAYEIQFALPVSPAGTGRYFRLAVQSTP